MKQSWANLGYDSRPLLDPELQYLAWYLKSQSGEAHQAPVREVIRDGLAVLVKALVLERKHGSAYHFWGETNWYWFEVEVSGQRRTVDVSLAIYDSFEPGRTVTMAVLPTLDKVLTIDSLFNLDA